MHAGEIANGDYRAVCDHENGRVFDRFLLEWMRNAAANWPLVCGAPGIKLWINRFPNIPVLVVNAGPSLEDAIPLLPEARKRMILVAVDRAATRLRDEGIIPDLTVSLDAQEVVCDFFRNHLPGELVAMCFSQHPELIKMIPAEDRVMYSQYVPGNRFWDIVNVKYFHGHADYWGRVTAGGNVGASAMDIAGSFSANPVVLVGLDLCYKYKPYDVRPMPGLVPNFLLHASDVLDNTRLAHVETCNNFVLAARFYREVYFSHIIRDYIQTSDRSILMDAPNMRLQSLADTIEEFKDSPALDFRWHIRKRLKRK